MKLRKTTTSDVIGYLVDPNGVILVDDQDDGVVYVDEVGRYLLTAKQRDTNLLAYS